jgi:phosphatidylglycerophosphatase A
MLFRRHVVMCLATGCYVGRFPIAPGTLGSLVGVLVAWGLSFLIWPLAVAATLVLMFAAVWIAKEAERQLDRKDPGCIVIDEIVGQCITLFCLPLTFGTCAAGFFLFRLFDIAKPPPARYLERRLSGGWGVVMDDVAAGIMAHIALRLGLALAA